MKKPTVFKVRDYLKTHGAFGARCAVPAREITTDLFGADTPGTRRALRKEVEAERRAGQLICSSTGRVNGYYWPATDGEIIEEYHKMDRAIRRKAMIIQTFRKRVYELKEKERAAAEGPDLFSDPQGKSAADVQEGVDPPADFPAKCSTSSGKSDTPVDLTE